jgi:hypothetical protein
MMILRNFLPAFLCFLKKGRSEAKALSADGHAADAERLMREWSEN